MRTFYLTTPIYYVTAKPHLGHAYTTVVGDALARWHRLLGDSVDFLTGTDEHGLKVQQYAVAAGKSPQAFVDDVAPLYERAWQRLNISHDDFIRTTEPRHRIGVEALLQRCHDAGDIEPGVYAGRYCVACEEYYTDDELDPGDLCRIHHRPVDYYEEDNYFFRLSRFEQRLLDWYDAHPDGLIRRYNSDLANNLGNLVSRVTTIVAKTCDGIGPPPGDGGALADAAAQAAARTADAWAAFAPSEALEATWSLIGAANTHLEQHQPWKQNPGAALDRVLGDALEAIRIVSILAAPALPQTSQAIWERIGLTGRIDAQRLPSAVAWGGYPGRTRVSVDKPLFPRR